MTLEEIKQKLGAFEEKVKAFVEGIAVPDVEKAEAFAKSATSSAVADFGKLAHELHEHMTGYVGALEARVAKLEETAAGLLQGHAALTESHAALVAQVSALPGTIQPVSPPAGGVMTVAQREAAAAAAAPVSGDAKPA